MIGASTQNGMQIAGAGGDIQDIAKIVKSVKADIQHIKT